MGYSGPLSLGWHKALFVSSRGPKYAGSVYLESKLEVGHVTANYCAPEACYLYRADYGHVWLIQGN